MLNKLEEKSFWFISKSFSPETKSFIGNILQFLHKIVYPKKTFTFQNKKYKYFYHNYNLAWRNDRTVEIPIVWKTVNEYQEKKILEVGNVLSHYFPINHDVLDKYEKAKGVINKDVLDFKPRKKYDLIVSISTIEHIGWNERPRDPQKVLRALDNLGKLLAPGGQMVVTFPLGYNKNLDKFLKKDKLPFNKKYYLKKISRGNKWRQVGWNEVKDSKYNSPLRYANAVVIGIVNN